GIRSSSGYYTNNQIVNNLIYANLNQGILIQSTSGLPTEVVNNTIYQPLGDAVDIQNNSQNVHLRNNILWTQSGFAIAVASNSQLGFASNFNIFVTTGTGQVGQWQGIARPTLASWQTADFTDADSLARDPLFVTNVNTTPVGYQSAIQDGRGDDFHEQSL